MSAFSAGGEYADRAAFSLGLMAMDQGDAARAAEFFRKASGSVETGIRLQARLDLAQCSLKLGKPDDALSALEEDSGKRSFKDIYYSGRFLLAEALRMKGQYMESAAILKKLLVKKEYAETAMGELQTLVETALEHGTPPGKGLPGKFMELWDFAGVCLMQRERAGFVSKVATRLEGVDTGEFVAVSRWLTRNGNPEIKRQAARKLAVYYLQRGDGRRAALFFRQGGFAAGDENTLRLRAGIRYLNGDFKGAERDVLAIKNPSEGDLELLAKAIPLAKDFGAVNLVQKRLSKIAAPAALYLPVADAMYEKGMRAKALEYYNDAVAASAASKQGNRPGKGASGGGKALSPSDLKWALFRIQTLEKDPNGTLGDLAGEGGLMGRYAAARRLEEGVMASAEAAR